jgi:hypothetical protein
MTKLHSQEISRNRWKLIVWTPIILGLIVFSVFSSTFFIPKEAIIWAWLSMVGGLLMGWGFGLAYSRIFKIKGIDK